MEVTSMSPSLAMWRELVSDSLDLALLQAERSNATLHVQCTEGRF